MEAFAVRDLREHTGELVRNAENGEYSVVSKHGKPLFVALPFNDAMLRAGVNVALADKLVMNGELSVAAGAKLASLPYARYLQHLGSLGYSMLDVAPNLSAELAILQGHMGANSAAPAATKSVKTPRKPK
jgi:prevent-host-death family protein